ncbi:uncharacterized protein METZ01_LOCUS192340 [marine metagenome]|uniref:Uncharacterized protein n=1 Tax=marine metagenome TaxID=408172 RepID=A0A382DLX0_9ZZZZ
MTNKRFNNLTGYREEYYPDGLLKRKWRGSFDNRLGVWELFDKQGELVWFGCYPDPEGPYEYDSEMEFSESGYYRGVRQWRGKLDKGKEEGLWEYFDDKGRLKEYGKYCQGVKEGLWEYFDDKGRLEEYGKYCQGVREGLWEFWVEGLGYEKNYKNGILDHYEGFDENIREGEIDCIKISRTLPKENQDYDINEKGEEIRYRFSASYKTVIDDEYSFIEMRDGPYEEYYMQNIFLEIYNKIKKHKSLKFRASYKKGVLNGLCQYFDEGGNLTKSEIWENGKLIE